MLKTKRIAAILLCTLVACLQPFPAAAQDGITPTSVTFGQSAVLSGPLSGTVIENVKVAQLYFDQVNAQGGVHGRKIKLVSLDDELKPEKALANYKKLLDEEKVLATFLGVGTGTTAAVLPLLEEKRVPLIAPLAIGDSVRAKSGRMVYYTRAGYGDESEKIIQHLTTVGQTKIALATLDNAGGREVAATIDGQLAKRNNKLVQTQFIAPNGSNIAAAAKAIAAAQPQAVVLFSGGAASGEFVKQLFENKFTGQVFCYSIVSAEIVSKVVGDKARGISFSQVTQYPWDTTVKLVKEYQDLAKLGNVPVNYNGMGGFISAKLVVEALRRAGKNLTRENFVAALDGAPYDLGGVLLNFGNGNRLGTGYVDLVIISREGKFLR